MHCQGTRRGKDFSATPKPCSSSNNKQPENSKGPIFWEKHSAVAFTNNARSIMEEGYGEVLEPENSSCRVGGFGDTNSVLSNMVKQPICHADRGPVRLRGQAFGTTGTVGRQTGQ